LKITPLLCTIARPIALGISLALALLCPQAQAAVTAKNFAYDNCDLVGSPTVTVAISGELNQQAQRYDYLSQWQEIEHSPGWSCIRYGQPNESVLTSGIKLSNMPEDLAMGFVADDGNTYSIYKADAEGQIGYIMRYRLIIPQVDKAHPWQPVTVNNQNNWDQRLNIKRTNQRDYHAVIAHQIRLVKWGQGATFPSRGFSFQFRAATFVYLSDVKEPKPRPKGYPPAQSMLDRARRHSEVNVRMDRTDKTCRTTSSDQTVRLPTIGKDHLKGKGSSAGKTAFALELGNCDADINTIYYTLLPSANGVSENGILPPSG